MSLILEALRKSEAERRRGDMPNLHTELPHAPQPRRAKVPAWAWMLFVVATLAIAWWMAIDRTAPPATGSETVRQTPTVTDVPPPSVARNTALPPIRRLSPPPAPVAGAPVPSGAAPSGPDVVRAPEPVLTPPAAPARSTSLPIVAPIARGEGDETIALSDLSVEERKALPPLKLSMHMWNDDPARRFVILDGNRLGEGDRVGNAVIVAITSDGAVLDWNGRRIRLATH
jgi:general secretion pathway protein B